LRSARERAVVHIADRNAEPVEAVAAEIRASGGRATAYPVDVTDGICAFGPRMPGPSARQGVALAPLCRAVVSCMPPARRRRKRAATTRSRVADAVDRYTCSRFVTSAPFRNRGDGSANANAGHDLPEPLSGMSWLTAWAVLMRYEDADVPLDRTAAVKLAEAATTWAATSFET
jgi:hypothetical protein